MRCNKRTFIFKRILHNLDTAHCGPCTIQPRFRDHAYFSHATGFASYFLKHPKFPFLMLTHQYQTVTMAELMMFACGKVLHMGGMRPEHEFWEIFGLATFLLSFSRLFVLFMVFVRHLVQRTKTRCTAPKPAWYALHRLTQNVCVKVCNSRAQQPSEAKISTTGNPWSAQSDENAKAEPMAWVTQHLAIMLCSSGMLVRACMISRLPKLLVISFGGFIYRDTWCMNNTH